MKRKIQYVLWSGAILVLALSSCYSVTAQVEAANPSLQAIQQALTHKDETNTIVLVEELKRLLDAKANQFFVCGNGPSSDSQSNPHALFDAVLDELISRDGKPVVQMMKALLLNETIDENDKRKIWRAMEQKSADNFPIVLEAMDRSQTREYLLQIETNTKTEVEVRKGDTLLRIAQKAYPKLSIWSGADIVSFVNGFNLSNPIKAGSKLKIYPYKIIKDNPLAGLDGGGKSAGP